MLVEVAEYSVLAVVATVAIWRGSDWLAASSERLSAYYGLPAAVQGAVVVAVGSSFPELSSVVISTLLHGSFDLGVSAIVGSAVFNLLVIPALSGIYAEGVEADRTLVYKEAQFYMISVSVIVITFALAVIYHPVNPPLDPANGGLKGTVTRPLALIPVGFYAVYVFTQYHDAQDHDTEPDGSVNVPRQWLVLLASLGVIAVAVEGLVVSAKGFRSCPARPSSSGD